MKFRASLVNDCHSLHHFIVLLRSSEKCFLKSSKKKVACRKQKISIILAVDKIKVSVYLVIVNHYIFSRLSKTEVLSDKQYLLLAFGE